MKKLLLVFIVISGVALSQQQRKIVREINEGPQSHLGGQMEVIEKLKLTEEQQKQFGKLHDEMEKNQIALNAKVQSLHVDLRSLFRDDKPDQSKIETKIQEISKIETEMKLNHVNLWFSVNKILTADQQKIWKGHMEFMGRHGEMAPQPPMKMKKKIRIIEGNEDEDEEDDD